MMIRNLLVGLPAILVCMVVQVALAFWGVRYFIRQTSGATAERGSLFGLRPLLVVMLVMMLGTVVQIEQALFRSPADVARSDQPKLIFASRFVRESAFAIASSSVILPSMCSW